MGLREEEIGSAADLPSMLNRDCDLRLRRRGEVSDEVFDRVEAALSHHYHRAFEGISFKYGGGRRPEPIDVVIAEVLASGYQMSVSGSGTPRMDFYLRGGTRN